MTESSTELTTVEHHMDALKTKSVADLRLELAAGLTLTANTLARLAAVWRELESRGEDLSDLKIGLAKNLPLIASGRLAAEAVVAFAGRIVVLKRLEGMPIRQQIALANGQKVAVYTPANDKEVDLAINAMPAHVVTTVFCNGVLRTPAEQKVAMVITRKAMKKRVRKFTVEVDKRRSVVRVGQAHVPLAAIVSALADAAGGNVEVTESATRPAKTIACKVTDEEKERIEAAAKAHDMTVDAMVRKAVLAMWCL